LAKFGEEDNAGNEGQGIGYGQKRIGFFENIHWLFPGETTLGEVLGEQLKYAIYSCWSTSTGECCLTFSHHRACCRLRVAICSAKKDLQWETFAGRGNMGSITIKCPACETKNKISDIKQHLHLRCGKCRQSLDMRSHVVPVDLGDASMDAFLQVANLPVLVDFYSPTCGPCARLSPLLDSFARQFLGRIIVAKVDTSKNPGCSAHFQIRGVPTLIFFKNGRAVEQILGLPDANQLKVKMEYFAG